MRDTITCAIISFFCGSGITLSIEWIHIYEHAVETAIVAFVGGLAGTIGGLIIAFFVKKLKLGKYFHK